MSLGERLRYARTKTDQTQREVAKKAGINYKTLSNWENNVSNPAPDDLLVLAKIYNVSTDYLLGRESSPMFNPPAGFFDDPDVGARVEQLKTNPKFRLLLCASKDLTSDELDSLIALAEHYAKKHGMTE